MTRERNIEDGEERYDQANIFLNLKLEKSMELIRNIQFGNPGNIYYLQTSDSIPVEYIISEGRKGRNFELSQSRSQVCLITLQYPSLT